MSIELSKHYVTNEGEKITCYTKTDKFAFMCPYEILEDDRIKLLVGKTTVYSNEQLGKDDNTPIESIETLELMKE